jgi:catechol 2,3-dioxygenase-like lactoylglutathione lyase family enzyme
MAVTLIGAHHTSFPVRDLARARRFYEGVLGLEQIPRPELGVPGVWYRAGACEVHLIQTPDGLDLGTPAPSLNPMARHAAFAVRDYGEALAALRAEGLEVIETGPERGQLWVRDPDGHIIELIEPK